MARDNPISFGNLTVPPSMRGTPNLEAGDKIIYSETIFERMKDESTHKSLKFHLLFRKPILLFSSTTLRSHMIANSSPPATQYLQFDALRLNSYGWPNYPFTAAITGFVRYILVGPFKTIKTFEERKNYHWTLVHQNLCHLVRQVTRIIKFTELLENEKFMLMINMAGIELPLTSRSYPEQKLPPSPCKTAQCRSGSCSNSLFINVS